MVDQFSMYLFDNDCLFCLCLCLCHTCWIVSVARVVASVMDGKHFTNIVACIISLMLILKCAIISTMMLHYQYVLKSQKTELITPLCYNKL